jgi:hypothetical protein
LVLSLDWEPTRSCEWMNSLPKERWRIVIEYVGIIIRLVAGCGPIMTQNLKHVKLMWDRAILCPCA